jgi:hypothetical protein
MNPELIEHLKKAAASAKPPMPAEVAAMLANPPPGIDPDLVRAHYAEPEYAVIETTVAEPEPKKRKRRTKAEMEAARAAEAPVQTRVSQQDFADPEPEPQTYIEADDFEALLDDVEARQSTTRTVDQRFELLCTCASANMTPTDATAYLALLETPVA